MDRILTFDCYGTLVNTSPLYDFVGDVAEGNGLSRGEAKHTFVSYEDRLMYGEDFIPYDQLVKHALEYCDLELRADVFLRQWEQALEIHRRFQPFDEVVECLQVLRHNGYRLYLMSNCIHSIMKYHLEAMGDPFDGVFLAEDTRCYKPSLSFFRQVQDSLQLNQHEHCHIAKGYWWDIVPCSKLGWKKVWVNRENKNGSPRHQPYEIVNDLDGVLRLFGLKR